MMPRCHDGATYLLAQQGSDGTEEAVACCATCHSVLAVGPRTEVCAAL